MGAEAGQCGRGSRHSEAGRPGGGLQERPRSARGLQSRSPPLGATGQQIKATKSPLRRSQRGQEGDSRGFPRPGRAVWAGPHRETHAHPGSSPSSATPDILNLSQRPGWPRPLPAPESGARGRNHALPTCAAQLATLGPFCSEQAHLGLGSTPVSYRLKDSGGGCTA